MKILVLSKTGRILPLAYTLMEEGNQVRLYRSRNGINRAGDGILDVAESWRPNVPWSDLVLVESPDLAPASALQTMGRPFLGTSDLGYDLNQNYEYQRQAFNASKLRIPETYDIEFPDEVNQMVNAWRMPGYRVVFGDHSFDMTTEAQMRWLADNVDLNYPELFQRIVPGSRLVHEGWFNGREWASPFVRLYFEHLSVSEGSLVGDTSIGCMAHGVGDDDLTEKSVTPLEKFLAEHSYRGPVSVSFVVADTGIWCTSIRCGFNFSAIPILLEGMMEPVGDFLFELAQGTRDYLEFGPDLVGSAEVNYGGNHVENFHRFPVDNLSKITAQHFKFQDVIVDEDDPMLYRMAGETGILGYATAFGPRTDIVRKRIACSVRSLRIPYVSFRNTVGGAYEKARKNMSDAKLGYV